MTASKEISRRQRIYRALLRLLPFDFQREYGGDMEDVFQEESAALRGRTPAAHASLWLRTARGITAAAIGEHIDNLHHDVRLSIRSLAKSPGFTAAALTMLALGIGINAAVFTVINAALFTGFPLVHHSDRIVQITTSKNAVFYPDFEYWQAQTKSFEGMALTRGIFHTLADRSESVPESYFATEVTPGTFQMLGVRPILGRDFSASDQEPGSEPVIVLRYDTWTKQFGGDPQIVGQIVKLDGQPARVIGVMPQGFSFPADQHLWTAMIPTPAAMRRDTPYAPYAFARLADGVTVEKARTEMALIGGRLSSDYPASNHDVTPIVTGFDEWFVGANAATLYKTLWGAVVFVLLIICANVANLLLERAVGRSHEISIRLALGAGRWRIVRQLLVESLLLSILGGILGWWIAKGGVDIYYLAQVNSYSSRVLTLTMDYRVLAYLIIISIGAGLSVALAAATHLTKVNIHRTSKEDGRGVAGGKQARRLSNILVGFEMVFAIVLLASAGVLSRSFLNVYKADIGVDTANVLQMSLNPPLTKYPGPEARSLLYREIENRLAATPGVVSIGFGNVAPLDGAPHFPFEIADAPASEERFLPTVPRLVVSPGYFPTLGVRMTAGREFNESDSATSEPVAIVNRRFADAYWPTESPLGKRLRLYASVGQPSAWLTIVGVASNVVQEDDGTRQSFHPVVYLPLAQSSSFGFMFLRTSLPPKTLVSEIRRHMYEMDPDIPVRILVPLAEQYDRLNALRRNSTVLFLVFSVIALAVASIGLYASVSHSVNRRIQEIGIRIAVGATGSDILKLVFQQGAVPVGMGVGVGLAASFALNRVLKSQLVGVSPADPVALTVASTVLILSAALGCWLPARRATRVDPVVALRHE